MTAGYVEARCTVPSSTTLSASNSGGGPTSVSLTAGNYYISELVAHLQSALNAQRAGSGGATWTVSLSYTGASPTGLVTISMSAGNFSITWTTAELGTILGHTTITTQTSVTGANHARGLWLPDRPLNLDGDPRMQPMVTDLRQSESPTGFVLGLVGNVKYRHRGLRWVHVERDRTWATSTATTSWEQFIKDVQLGQGHTWYTPSSRVKIADQTGNLVSSDVDSISWQMKGINSVEPRKMSEAWTGLWLIEIPEIVSDGT